MIANGRTIRFSALKQISRDPEDPNDKPGAAAGSCVDNPAATSFEVAKTGPGGGVHGSLAVRSTGIGDI